MRGSANRGPVVSGRTAGTYQCTGADCRHVCCTGFRKRQEESPCSPQDGQHICSHLCDQDRGYSVHQTNSSCMSDLGLVLQRQITLSVTPTGFGQSGHRQRIQRSANVSRVEAPRRDLQANQYSTRTIASRLVAESSAGPLRELETRPRGRWGPMLFISAEKA